MTLTPVQRDELRRLAEKATPGPWGWRGHDDGCVELCTLHSGYLRVVSAMRGEPCIVTLADGDPALTAEACEDCRAKWAEWERTEKRDSDGVRWRNDDVWEGYRCPKPENLGTVWLWDAKGFVRPANHWGAREREYRSDVARVDHPDAELIAAARNALPALLDALDAADAPTPGPDGRYWYLCEYGHRMVSSDPDYEACTAEPTPGTFEPVEVCGADIEWRLIPYERGGVVCPGTDTETTPDG